MCNNVCIDFCTKLPTTMEHLKHFLFRYRIISTRRHSHKSLRQRNNLSMFNIHKSNAIRFKHNSFTEFSDKRSKSKEKRTNYPFNRETITNKKLWQNNVLSRRQHLMAPSQPIPLHQLWPKRSHGSSIREPWSVVEAMASHIFWRHLNNEICNCFTKEYYFYSPPQFSIRLQERQRLLVYLGDQMSAPASAEEL